MFERMERFFRKKIKKFGPLPEGKRELSGTNVAILATDGFEQSELFEPKEALDKAGARTQIISLRPGKIKAWNKTDWGKSIAVDMTVREAWDFEFDYLFIPGGVMNPDKLRADPEAVAFAMAFMNKHRPIATICHGPQLLVEMGMAKGKTLTSSPSIKTDLQNAGAHWIDQAVVVDHFLITSRGPQDIPTFNETIMREFAKHKLIPLIPDTEGYIVTL